MTQHEEISSWMDGEADSTNAASMSAKVLHDPQGLQRWNDWHLIGDVMRSPSLARPSSVASRVADKLQTEPLHFPRAAAPNAATNHKAVPIRRRSPLVYGGAIAAAIAFVAFIAFGPTLQQGGFVEMIAASMPSPTTRSSDQPVTPVALEDPRLRDLLDAHGSMSIRPVSAEVR